MLSDIFPTGYHGTELAGVSPGDTVAIFGAGPVGLMAAHSAALRGAAQVFVVDKAADRLALAEQYGATAVNFADADPAEVIIDATDGAGVDCGVEAVGYQAHDPAGQEHPEMVLDKLVEVVRATGRIGVVGVYDPDDPGAATEDAKQGRYGFNYGLVFDKAISMGHGQCPVKRYNHQLRDLIIRGKARPSLIVSHELPLDAGPRRLRPVRPAERRLDQGPAQPGARPPDGSPRRGAGSDYRNRRRVRLAAGAVPDFYVRREDRDGGIGRPGCPGHESSRRWRAG